MVNTYFYGIDFKKIRLYCKVKLDKIYDEKASYREFLNVNLNIDYDKFYEVISIDLCEQLVRIEVDYKKYKNGIKDEDRIKITLRFENVEFAYFFEDTKKEELNVMEM
ncbi:MAG: hypothetical protein PHT03_02605 [Bacilli bacterium]|nr:hypothetical protein [Bacilli bacterium]